MSTTKIPISFSYAVNHDGRIDAVTDTVIADLATLSQAELTPVLTLYDISDGQRIETETLFARRDGETFFMRSHDSRDHLSLMVNHDHDPTLPAASFRHNKSAQHERKAAIKRLQSSLSDYIMVDGVIYTLKGRPMLIDCVILNGPINNRQVTVSFPSPAELKKQLRQDPESPCLMLDIPTFEAALRNKGHHVLPARVEVVIHDPDRRFRRTAENKGPVKRWLNRIGL